ncbi:ABC transporter family protein, partial [Vibrio parahaemolyticus VPTS-2010]
RTTLAS